MKDKFPTVLPHCSVEFISGMCHALSNDDGDVYVEIRSVNGQPVAVMKREEIDQSLPVFLRKIAT